MRPDTDLWFKRVEEVVYFGIGLLLIVAAGAMLFSSAWGFASDLSAAGMGTQALVMLDKLLLVLMLVELLYTVRVSLRTHTLLPEPFLLVGLIAGIRRVLVITAEAWNMGDVDEAAFDRAMLELGLLTALTLALVASVILLRRFPARQAESAAGPTAE
jgi:uncharacterized membrane protein (DUF373 family)